MTCLPHGKAGVVTDQVGLHMPTPLLASVTNEGCRAYSASIGAYRGVCGLFLGSQARPCGTTSVLNTRPQGTDWLAAQTLCALFRDHPQNSQENQIGTSGPSCLLAQDPQLWVEVSGASLERYHHAPWSLHPNTGQSCSSCKHGHCPELMHTLSAGFLPPTCPPTDVCHIPHPLKTTLGHLLRSPSRSCVLEL